MWTIHRFCAMKFILKKLVDHQIKIWQINASISEITCKELPKMTIWSLSSRINAINLQWILFIKVGRFNIVWTEIGPSVHQRLKRKKKKMKENAIKKYYISHACTHTQQIWSNWGYTTLTYPLADCKYGQTQQYTIFMCGTKTRTHTQSVGIEQIQLTLSPITKVRVVYTVGRGCGQYVLDQFLRTCMIYF